MQYTAIVKNLIGLKPGRKANMLVTGLWSMQGYDEISKFCDINVVANNNTDNNCTKMVDPSQWKIDKDASFFYMCSNETVNGFEFDENTFPWHLIPNDMPIIGDMSSNIGTKPVRWDKYAMVFMGAQKNLGAAGCTIMIIRNDLFGHAEKDTPILCDWALHEKSPDTYYNTPAIYPMYVTGMNVSYMNEMGGLEVYEQMAKRRSDILWSFIDSTNGYYKSKITDKNYRSRINVIFRIQGGNKDLEEMFMSEASKAGIVQIRGHTFNPGIRVSMYNAMPVEGTIYLT
jgi:phosphoserine aminotransferase